MAAMVAPRRPGGSPWAWALLLCAKLLRLSGAQPLPSLRFLEQNLAPAPPPPPAAVKELLRCPDDHYQDSGILWVCGGALGRGVVPLGPNGRVLVAILPAGLRNFSAAVTTNLNAVVELHDEAESQGEGVDGLLNEGVNGTFGKQPSARREPMPRDPAFLSDSSIQYVRTSATTGELYVAGTLGKNLLLHIVNNGQEAGRVVIDYRFDGVDACEDGVPKGCEEYDEFKARGEVEAWSAWARQTFGNVDRAWLTLASVAATSSPPTARRLQSNEKIGWFGWGAVWDYWGGSVSGLSGGQQAFHFLDGDHDSAISQEEFAAGYHAGDPSTTSSGPHPLLWFLLFLCLIGAVLFYFRKHPIVQALFKGDWEEIKTLLSLHEIVDKFFPKSPGQEASTARLMPAKLTEEEQEPAEERFKQTREKFCSVMSCAWGRESKSKAPSMPQQTSDEDEVAALVRTMRVNIKDETVEEACLTRLEDLALDKKLKPHIADCGGPDAILEAMYAHPTSSGVQEHACAVLGNQASQSERQQRGLVEQGAMRAVLKAMAEHTASSSVQETGCWALRECSLVSEGRREIADCGGLDRTLRAMQNHQRSPAVLEHGCMALAYLAYDAELRRWIAYDGGINVILRSMRSQPNDDVVQEAACLALRNLGCSQETRQAVLELQADEAVVEAMRFHGKSATLQETACDALLILDPGAPRLTELRVHTGMLTSLETHPRAEGMQEKALRLLAYYVKGGGMEAMMSTATTDPSQTSAWLARATKLAQAAKANLHSSAEVQAAADEATAAISSAG